jgi:hypothetical protein
MIIVRESFIAKPGMAGKLAKMFKAVFGEMPDAGKIKIMTDLTGKFNQVVIETEMDNLSSLETRMRDYMSNSAMHDKMAGYTEMYKNGKREIYQIV